MRKDGSGGDLLLEAMAQALAKGEGGPPALGRRKGGALPTEGAGAGPEAGATLDCSPAPRRQYCWSKWTGEERGRVK